MASCTASPSTGGALARTTRCAGLPSATRAARTPSTSWTPSRAANRAIQALAAALLGDSQDSDYWRHHAQSLLTLFIIAARRSLVASLHDVQRALNDNAAFGATLAAATYSDFIPDDELARAAQLAAAAYAELAENARAAVRATVAGSLTIFASPDVARNTMRSSFELAELCDGKAAMTLYLTFAPHDPGPAPAVDSRLPGPSRPPRHASMPAGGREPPTAGARRLRRPGPALP